MSNRADKCVVICGILAILLALALLTGCVTCVQVVDIVPVNVDLIDSTIGYEEASD